MFKSKNLYTKKLLDIPSTFLNPVPVVMVSCCGISEERNKPNIITLAWAGTINSEPPMLSVSIRKSRFSHQQILESREFVVNLVNEDLLESCDFCGVKSGRDMDKFEVCNLTKEDAEGLQYAPAIKNSPVSLSCKVTQVVELGSHDLFLAEIIAVSVADELYEENGKINLRKAKLVAYSHGEYWSLRSVEGFFGFSLASDEIRKRRIPSKTSKPPVGTSKKKYGGNQTKAIRKGNR